MSALTLAAATAAAADALIIEAQELRSAGMVARNVSLRLTPGTGTALAAQANVAQLDLGATLGKLTRLRFSCPQARLAEPRFDCQNLQVAGLSSLIGDLGLRTSLEWRSDTSVLRFAAKGQKFAGGQVELTAVSNPRGWQLHGTTSGAGVAGLRGFMAHWFALPASIESGGNAQLAFTASGHAALDVANLALQLAGVNFGNEDATVAGEKLAASLQLDLRRAGSDYELSAHVSSNAGQALAGPVLLDFQANPLELRATGRWQGDAITFGDIRVTQQKLSQLSGRAVLRPAGSPYIRSATFNIDELDFPAAYSSFLQIALAAGDFGTLRTTGHIHGNVELANDAVSRLEATFDGIDVSEQKGKFTMQQLHGELHWLPQSAPPPDVSWLAWKSGSAYGLSGGATRLDFLARGLGFELARPARVPVFDGALRIDALAARDLTTPQVTVRFAGEIEPISMPLLSKAFGWPELSGQLSGKIPRVDYRDKLLTFSGDVEAQVFDGRVVGSNLRLKDPLGPWPRAFADVRARDLDLALVTNAFSIGSITGRLEADILGLELFDWSPVAFDASLRTPAGDRSKHRISAKAVGDLSNIGGGGGGVVKALQSGAFSMFDQYDYARLGIRCKLDNEVCLMSGLEPAGIGYYILQGKGLPHIDIIGNAGRVNWPQLRSQIAASMRGEGKLRID